MRAPGSPPASAGDCVAGARPEAGPRRGRAEVFPEIPRKRGPGRVLVGFPARRGQTRYFASPRAGASTSAYHRPARRPVRGRSPVAAPEISLEDGKARKTLDPRLRVLGRRADARE
ncbi:MAG: hypothetical protein BroJett026_19190 [Betaproteobacteria bacterium]|nr:MAG: hypothetical protein BroJett026_19190 [Betaproteobacteria bacterium]